MSLINRLTMTKEDWDNLPGGTEEAAWLTRRTIKLSLGADTAQEILDIFSHLEKCNSIYFCSHDLLQVLPKAGYWFACLAGLSAKTLGNIQRGPEAFGLNRSVKNMVEGFWSNRNYSAEEQKAFSLWINDEIDRLYPENTRSPLGALSIASMIAGGRVLGQSQNKGGDDAVTICKSELVGALNDLNYRVQVVGADNNWCDYTPNLAISQQQHIRVPNRAIFQFLPGGNRPDMVVYNDNQNNDTFVQPTLPDAGKDTNLIAVAEIKGRLDLANAWESWMPQVAAHMRQWSVEYRTTARLFIGTLLNAEMTGLVRESTRENLRALHNERTKGVRKLTAAYNITKVADRDELSVNRFNCLVQEMCAGDL